MNNRIKKILKVKGFTLIELIVSIFIFAMITVAILAIFIATSSAYQKANAIKNVKENVEYAVNSIAKDVRMGKVEKTDGTGTGKPLADGTRENYLMLSRNKGGKVCYILDNANSVMQIAESVSGKSCPSPGDAAYKDLLKLPAGMTFATGAGFYSKTTDITNSPKSRGWVEINLNIQPAAGKEMETDQINVQTVVSSRDYGWEDMTP